MDQIKISLDYQPFNQPHSELWIQGITAFINSGQQLTDVERVYNFNDYSTEFRSTIENCNTVINSLNNIYNLDISKINAESLQEDVNHVHTYFVESNRQQDHNPLWSKLNEYLHGLEIIQRSQGKQTQGQVFCSLPNAVKYDIPKQSYSAFTTKKHFGYCYANYPHVGRHILEMYNARDEHAHDEDILPQHKIAGDFYLWFGNNTPESYDMERMQNIQQWFYTNNLQDKLGMSWGDPRLAIGWLPVAEIDPKINKQNLIGLHRLEKIEIV